MTTKRGKFFAVVLLAIIGVITYGLLRQSAEPENQGHSLSYWTAELYSPRDKLFSSQVNPTEQRETAIRAIGTNAIPFLLKWMTHSSRPSELRSKVQNMYPKRIPLISGWADNDEHLRRTDGVPVAFQALGPSAAPALPDLRIIAQNSDFEHRFARVDFHGID